MTMIITYKRKRYLIGELADLSGISETNLRARLFRGWTIEEAINRPVNYRRKVTRSKDDQS